MMRRLYLWKAGRLLSVENRDSFKQPWAVLVLMGASCFLYHLPSTSVVKLRMLVERCAMQTTYTCIAENVVWSSSVSCDFGVFVLFLK